MLTMPEPLKRIREQSGASLVLFSIVLPIILLMGVITVDVGNWFVHKRHLQTQVDAAAFAGGPQFVGCFNDPTAANMAIASRALAYAGDTLRLGQLGPGAPASTTNYQVQTPADVRAALNSSAYWKTGDPTDGSTLDNTLGTPCSTAFLDVKATDDEAPLLWGLIPFTASPKTHARIEIRDLESQIGVLPWAVPEIDPKAVVALFVNEDTGAVFDYQELMSNDIPTLPWSEWSTSTGQERVVLDGGRDNTGIVILVSKNDATPVVTGSLAAICGQDPGLVGCYGGSTQTSGISFIHAYNGGYNGSLTSPQPRQVELFATGCSAADLSAPYFTLDGGCSAVVQAVIDFGVAGDPRDLPTCALVEDMTWSAGGLDDSRGTWTGSVPLTAASGRNPLNIRTQTGPEVKKNKPPVCDQRPNNPVLNNVAVPYVATDDIGERSGPVQYLKLTAKHADGTAVGDANSVERNGFGNDYYNYTVTVGLPKPNSIGNYTDPPLLLRMASPSGSQNQAWDCDKNIRFEDEIKDGCRTTYIENYRDTDGDGSKEWNNLLCAGWGTGNLPPPTFNGPSPYPSDCVITETGDKTGQLRGGLKSRFESPCVDNNWPDNATEAANFFGPDGGGYGNDPRYVTLIITDDTAFTGSGNEALPIKYFAGFYVTGWDLANGNGPNSTNGCPDPDGAGPRKGNDSHPIYGSSYAQSLDNGDVWGYFVDIVVFSSSGTPSEDLCVFGSEPAACIPTLVE